MSTFQWIIVIEGFLAMIALGNIAGSLATIVSMYKGEKK